jgi:hypothetical protein
MERQTTTRPNATQTLPIVMSILNVSKQYTRNTLGSRDFTLEIGPGVLGLLGQDSVPS